MDAEEDAGRRRGVVIYIFIYLKASKRQMELLEKKSTTSNKHFPRNLIPLAYISGTALYISNTTTLFSKNQILARYQFVVHVPGPLLRVDNRYFSCGGDLLCKPFSYNDFCRCPFEYLYGGTYDSNLIPKAATFVIVTSR